jgi:hypothetical protein
MSTNFGAGFHVAPGRVVDTSAYRRYIGRWSRLFVPAVLAAAEVALGYRVLDVPTGTVEVYRRSPTQVRRFARANGRGPRVGNHQTRNLDQLLSPPIPLGDNDTVQSRQ